MPFEWFAPGLAFVVGLLFGSFLNVVIHRLPRMMERDWLREARHMLGEDAPAPAHGAATQATKNDSKLSNTGRGNGDDSPYNLAVPRSACPSCGHVIRWHENIPVLSWLWLRGRCSACRARIGWRYPAVELVGGLIAAFAAHQWGLTWSALAWAGFALTLVALACIDWDTTLLPDDLTLPLLWAGLIGSHLGWTGVTLPDALWGAVAGYLSLWSIYWAFKLLTGKEGMGYGDFKLLAALGVWFGWQGLLPIVLLSSLVGAVVGIGLKLTNGLREGGQMPFGPFLAGAGLLLWVMGKATVLDWIGLRMLAP